MITQHTEQSERDELSDDEARDMALKAGGDDFAFRNKDGEGWTLKYCFRLSELKRLIRMAFDAALLSEDKAGGEPVARVEVMNTGGNAGIATRIVEIYNPHRDALRPGDLLYTRPQPAERKPLTEDQIDRALIDAKVAELPSQYVWIEIEIARAIEAAHGIKE